MDLAVKASVGLRQLGGLVDEGVILRDHVIEHLNFLGGGMLRGQLSRKPLKRGAHGVKLRHLAVIKRGDNQ